jgi:S1-C subfamily serine protease
MTTMRHVWILAALFAVPSALSGQAPSVLHVTVTLLDAAQMPTPVARHALLVSDNPATSAPRRVLTGVNGTVDITLRPGSYTIESDRPVTFLGKNYQWTEIVEVVAGRAAILALTMQNAEVLSPSTSSPDPSSSPEADPALQVSHWQESILGVWSPTSLASGFLVDARGLIATHRSGVGRATSVEVQVSPTVKVPGRVLVADDARDVAILWVDPSVVSTRTPLPLPCPPGAAPSLDDRQEIVTMVSSSTRGPVEPVDGEVTGLHPRAVDTDLRLAFGGVGGPAFNEKGEVVGLTSVQPDADPRQRSDVLVVRVGLVCEAVSAAQANLPGGAPPQPTRLPVEPSRPYPANALEAAARDSTGTTVPAIVSSSDFDVAFITTPTVYRAQQRTDWTGGRGTRAPEVEARIGQLTEFGAWSDYLADLPPVLIVRVTPKMVEGFWKRLAREAARTQGAALPAFKDFKSDFLRMRASCGSVEVVPIHPLVIEHPVSEKDVIREGLHVFHPDALGPHCGKVTLSLYSEKTPEKADTLTIDPKLIEQIWQDYAPYRSSGR